MRPKQQQSPPSPCNMRMRGHRCEVHDLQPELATPKAPVLHWQFVQWRCFFSVFRPSMLAEQTVGVPVFSNPQQPRPLKSPGLTQASVRPNPPLGNTLITRQILASRRSIAALSWLESQHAAGCWKQHRPPNALRRLAVGPMQSHIISCHLTSSQLFAVAVSRCRITKPTFPPWPR